MCKLWRRFFQILCAFQKVRTLPLQSSFKKNLMKSGMFEWYIIFFFLISATLIQMEISICFQFFHVRKKEKNDWIYNCTLRLDEKKMCSQKNILLRTLCSYSGDQFFTSPSQRGLIHYVNNWITNFGSIINCQHVIPVQVNIYESELYFRYLSHNMTMRLYLYFLVLYMLRTENFSEYQTEKF